MNTPHYLSGISQVQSYRILQYYVSAEIKKYKINPTQWFILGQINKHPNTRPADIAQLLRVEAPLITALTDDLQGKGLIDKKTNKDDKRVKQLLLTREARKLISKIENDLSKSLAPLLKGISTEDFKVYKRVLDTIIKNG